MQIENSPERVHFSDVNFSNNKIGIVQSVYYPEITNKLFEGACALLRAEGVTEITYLPVSGSFELVYGCVQLLHETKVDGIITLGCVIKGETEHDRYINASVAHTIAQLEVEYKIPIGFGLLTTNDMEQAINRSGGAFGNKGEEVAYAVLSALAHKPKILKL
jgi:6,7-dimethyl-8-ribityllumazine synthase